MMRTIQNKKKSNVTKKRSLPVAIRYGIVGLLLITSYHVVLGFFEPKFLPIKHIQLQGQLERVSSDSIRKRVRPYVRGFFSTNVMRLKKDLLAEPFISEVTIKRVWPDTLLVKLTELPIVASWGCEKAVTARGDVVNIKVDPAKHLPVFFGPEGQAMKMLEGYREFSTILTTLHVNVTEVDLNLRQSWEVMLDHHTKLLLGRKDMTERLTAFLKIYPKLKKIHGDHIEAIDLRHTNGISVQLISS